MPSSPKKAISTLLRQNIRLVKQLYPAISKQNLNALRDLTIAFAISVSVGDILSIYDKWYITHAGLLRLAARRRCRGIRTMLLRRLCDPTVCRWVFKATVYKSGLSKGFVGYADADPSNVAPMVRGAELRIAETRAVNRALRKAYGIGLCSVEELGSLTGSAPPRNYLPVAMPQPQNDSNNGHPRLKDKLCLLIRQHNLDPTLVKAYAAHFCGTATLQGASRELVEAFITQLEKEARQNRDSLLCKLNSFSRPAEVHS